MRENWGLQIVICAISLLVFFAGVSELRDYKRKPVHIWQKRMGVAWILIASVIAVATLLLKIV